MCQTSKWYPMETAPKEESTQILVWGPYGYIIAEWSQRAYDGKGHWGETLTGGYYGLDIPSNTECWTYLPEPPTEKKDMSIES